MLDKPTPTTQLQDALTHEEATHIGERLARMDDWRQILSSNSLTGIRENSARVGLAEAHRVFADLFEFSPKLQAIRSIIEPTLAEGVQGDEKSVNEAVLRTIAQAPSKPNEKIFARVFIDQEGMVQAVSRFIGAQRTELADSMGVYNLYHDHDAYMAPTVPEEKRLTLATALAADRDVQLATFAPEEAPKETPADAHKEPPRLPPVQHLVIKAPPVDNPTAPAVEIGRIIVDNASDTAPAIEQKHIMREPDIKMTSSVPDVNPADFKNACSACRPSSDLKGNGKIYFDAGSEKPSVVEEVRPHEGSNQDRGTQVDEAVALDNPSVAATLHKPASQIHTYKVVSDKATAFEARFASERVRPSAKRSGNSPARTARFRQHVADVGYFGVWRSFRAASKFVRVRKWTEALPEIIADIKTNDVQKTPVAMPQPHRGAGTPNSRMEWYLRPRDYGFDKR